MNHFVLVFETNSIGRGPKTALLINTKEKSNHIVCSLDFLCAYLRYLPQLKYSTQMLRKKSEKATTSVRKFLLPNSQKGFIGRKSENFVLHAA